MRKRGIEAGNWNRCVYNFGSVDLSELTQESKKANPFSEAFLFLQFCKKYDICKENLDARTCYTGKISAIYHITSFHRFISPANATKWYKHPILLTPLSF